VLRCGCVCVCVCVCMRKKEMVQDEGIYRFFKQRGQGFVVETQCEFEVLECCSFHPWTNSHGLHVEEQWPILL